MFSLQVFFSFFLYIPAIFMPWSIWSE